MAPTADRIKSQMFNNGTESLVCCLFPGHLLALDASSLQVSSCHAEFLQDPQAFWLWLHSFQNIHQTTNSSFKTTATEAFLPPHRGLITSLLCLYCAPRSELPSHQPLHHELTTLGGSYNHIPIFRPKLKGRHQLQL